MKRVAQSNETPNQLLFRYKYACFPQLGISPLQEPRDWTQNHPGCYTTRFAQDYASYVTSATICILGVEPSLCLFNHTPFILSQIHSKLLPMLALLVSAIAWIQGRKYVRIDRDHHHRIVYEMHSGEMYLNVGTLQEVAAYTLFVPKLGLRFIQVFVRLI